LTLSEINVRKNGRNMIYGNLQSVWASVGILIDVSEAGRRGDEHLREEDSGGCVYGLDLREDGEMRHRDESARHVGGGGSHGDAHPRQDDGKDLQAQPPSTVSTTATIIIHNHSTPSGPRSTPLPSVLPAPTFNLAPLFTSMPPFALLRSTDKEKVPFRRALFTFPFQ
jgi:hypothetical protein